jgi:hypothetical protein
MSHKLQSHFLSQPITARELLSPHWNSSHSNPPFSLFPSSIFSFLVFLSATSWQPGSRRFSFYSSCFFLFNLRMVELNQSKAPNMKKIKTSMMPQDILEMILSSHQMILSRLRSPIWEFHADLSGKLMARIENCNHRLRLRGFVIQAEQHFEWERWWNRSWILSGTGLRFVILIS